MPKRVFDLPSTERPEPIEFSIADVDYECLDDLPAQAVYLLSTLGDPIAETIAFIRGCLAPGYEDRFDEQLARKGRGQVVTQDVLSDVLDYLIGAYSNRPTPPPESSPGGRQATTAPSQPDYASIA